MSRTFPVPVGWALPCIGDVATLLAGYGFPTEYQGKSNGELPFFKVGDISEAWQRNERLLTSAKHYVTHDDAAQLRAKPLPKGSVVFAKIGAAISLNRRAIISTPSLIDNNCMGLAANADVLDTDYLFYFTCILRLGELSRASVVPSLRKSDIEPIPLPLPPLNEQHRIVAKIEELFSDLDAGVAALKRAKANLKRYRASVLKAAVEGKLTEEWRAKHPAKEPASELLARILKERRQKWESDQLAKFAAAGKQPPKNWRDKYVEPKPPETDGLPLIPQSWIWTTLDAMANVVGGVTKDQKKVNQPGMREVPYLRVANVQRGFLDLSEMKTISASEVDIAELRLEPGDMLFNEGGDRDKLGRGWVWSGELSECIHQNHVFRGRLVSQEIQPRFVSHHGNTFGKEWFIKAGKQTTNLASINLGVLRLFPVPIPPAEEQAEIISQVDEILSQIDATEKQIEHGLLRASRLRQSILNEAFSGRLVPQDPKDESASRLLERIRVEKAPRSDLETRSRGTKMKSHSRRPIIDVLKEHPKGIAPEELLSKAGFGITDVDAFYSELRSISSQIEEQRPEEPKINKWPKGAKILLRAKKA